MHVVLLEKKNDCEKELKHFIFKGVKIYGVQAFENEDAESFYRTLATDSDGSYLKLGSFSNICDFLMAICYREKGEEFLYVSLFSFLMH